MRIPNRPNGTEPYPSASTVEDVLVPLPEYFDVPLSKASRWGRSDDPMPVLLALLRQLQANEFESETTLGALVRSSRALMDADLVWLGLTDAATGELSMAHVSGAITTSFPKAQLTLTGLGGEAARRGRTLVINNYPEAPSAQSPIRRSLIEEQIKTLVMAPLITAAGLHGVIAAGRRDPRQFSPQESKLLGVLAAQAAITLRNGMMHAEESRQTELLGSSLLISQELRKCLLDGKGVDGVIKTLEGILSRAVTIESPLHSGAAPSNSQAPDGSGHRVQILAAGEELGWLVAGGEEPMSDLEHQALAHGATVVAAELLRQRTRQEAEWRLQGELLGELISAPSPLSGSLQRRSRHLGLDSDNTAVVLAARIEVGDASSRLLGALRAELGRLPGPEPTVLAVDHRDHLIVALVFPRSSSAEAVLSAVEHAARTGVPHTVGVSTGNPDLRLAYKQAEACLAIAVGTAAGATDGHQTCRADSFGILASVLTLDETSQATRQVRETLMKLYEADRSSRVPLLETLLLFVDSAGIHAAAARGFLHTSTLKYRLSRIEETMGWDLSDPELLYDLRVKLQLLTLLEARGEDPLGRLEATSAGTALRQSSETGVR